LAEIIKDAPAGPYWTKFGIRNKNYDGDGISPTWSSSALSEIKFYNAEQTGTSQDPKLVVNYTTFTPKVIIF